MSDASRSWARWRSATRPMIDRQRAVIATRLTVFPLRPDAALDAGAARGAWARSGRPTAAEAGLAQRRQREPAARPVRAEPPRQPDGRGAGLHGRRPGATRARCWRCTRAAARCCIKGRPAAQLPREVLPCFKYSIVDLADDRRTERRRRRAAPREHRATCSRACARSAEMEASFKRGAAAVLGWPIDDAVAQGQRRASRRAARPAGRSSS